MEYSRGRVKKKYRLGTASKSIFTKTSLAVRLELNYTKTLQSWFCRIQCFAIEP